MKYSQTLSFSSFVTSQAHFKNAVERTLKVPGYFARYTLSTLISLILFRLVRKTILRRPMCLSARASKNRISKRDVDSGKEYLLLSRMAS